MKDHDLKTWWERLWVPAMLSVYLIHVWTRPAHHPASWSPADGLVILGGLAFTAAAWENRPQKTGSPRPKWGYRAGLILCLAGLISKTITRL